MSSNPPAVPDMPTPKPTQSFSKKTKPATPDIIQFNDADLKIDQLSRMLFEDIGGIELISIARSDIINGQQVSYSLISNSSTIEQAYRPTRLVTPPGSTEEFFKNFAINLSNHIPKEGTGPNLLYVGEINSKAGCVGYPVLDRYTDELLACSSSYATAQALVEELSPDRNVVYSDPETGNLIIDVINMRPNELVEVEILKEGVVEDDTIY
jgi:hypothetical protein